MGQWSVTTAFADAVVRGRRYPRSRNLANAAVRGALLIDLARARLLVEHDDRLHASASRSGFPPADALLAAITSANPPDLARLVWRGPVGMPDVINELVARGWWERRPRQLWRLRATYRPTELLGTSPDDRIPVTFTHLAMSLFDSRTDTDDTEAEAANADLGPATWLGYPLVHQLVELRLWLDAVAHTPSGASA